MGRNDRIQELPPQCDKPSCKLFVTADHVVEALLALEDVVAGPLAEVEEED